MLIILLVVVIVIIYWWLRYIRKPKLMPYMLEHFLKTTDPVPLCGKPDVVWITRGGTLVIGDYKSRGNHQVFESEVIQLSVYKLLLEKTQKKPVADYGFIHFKKGRKVKVNLMSEKAVIKLYHRYWKVIGGKNKPCMTESKNYCKCCSHQFVCAK